MESTGKRRCVTRLVAGLVCLLALAFACNTPTIPIPPLRAASFTSIGIDTWRASGAGAASSGEVFLIVRATGDGVVARADNTDSYETPEFSARAGDTVEMFYRTAMGQVSASTCGVLAAGPVALGDCPP